MDRSPSVLKMETRLNQRRACAPLAVLSESLMPVIGPRMSATSFRLSDAVAVSSTSLGRELANIYLHARYYDPVLGIFPSPDPLNPQQPFVYGFGDAVNFRDPSGLDPEDPLIFPGGGGVCGNTGLEADSPDDCAWLLEEFNWNNGGWSGNYWSAFHNNSLGRPRFGGVRYYFERPAIVTPPVVTPTPPPGPTPPQRPNSPNKQNPSGPTAGVSIGASLEVGIGNTGVAAQGTIAAVVGVCGFAIQVTAGTRVLDNTFSGPGSAGYPGNHQIDYGESITGVAFASGLNGIVSNAGNPSRLAGSGISNNYAVGPLSLSGSQSHDRFGPVGSMSAGVGVGLSASHYPTATTPLLQLNSPLCK